MQFLLIAAALLITLVGPVATVLADATIPISPIG